MTTVRNEIDIAAPPGDVYGFVTTPGNWPRFHPSSLGVSGAVDHSLGVGEQCVEEFLVAGRRGATTWTVIERVPDRRWVIQSDLAGGTVTYDLGPADRGTRFVRTFTYLPRNLLHRVLDALFVRRRVEAESLQAVRQLKAVLEAPASSPA
jgi:hypothetical protein